MNTERKYKDGDKVWYIDRHTVIVEKVVVTSCSSNGYSILFYDKHRRFARECDLYQDQDAEKVVEIVEKLISKKQASLANFKKRHGLS